MSTKTDYSAEEWKAISGAQVAAGLLITVSDASGLVIAREAIAVGKAIARSALGGAPEIVKALAENVRNGDGRPELPDVPPGDRTQTQNALIGAIKAAVRAVEGKSPSEVEAYKAWLASVAAKMSHASKEGAFVGFGGPLPSGEEEEALKQLASVLAVGTRQTPAPS